MRHAYIKKHQHAKPANYFFRLGPEVFKSHEKIAAFDMQNRRHEQLGKNTRQDGKADTGVASPKDSKKCQISHLMLEFHVGPKRHKRQVN